VGGTHGRLEFTVVTGLTEGLQWTITAKRSESAKKLRERFSHSDRLNCDSLINSTHAHGKIPRAIKTILFSHFNIPCEMTLL
jgi:hypothetical protein